jgi:hypothetical protein
MIAAFAIALIAAAGASTARVDAVAIGPAATAIRTSGELSEEAWSAATPMDAFVQREPHDAAAPSQRTEFRVAYDASTLFVKVRAFDTEADKIVTYLTRRDLDSPCDWIHILIDSYHDKRTAYEFAVNPSGVKMDRYWYNDNNRDDSWDAVWDVSVSRDPGGWTAEFRIPFSQLRFTPSAAGVFGFAVSRQIGRLNETSTWPLLSRSDNGYVSSFGELGGLAMAASPKKLELVPYALGALTKQTTGGNPLLNRAAPDGAAGMDMKYALTPGLTFTGTINPDFGQVEADPAVVNLTAFETFFSERRPFFVEGSGNFNFATDCNDGACTGLFYSRRIGRAPQGLDDLPDDDNVYTDAPAQTTILGAGKLTGRVGKYSIGMMQAFTREETARVLTGTIPSRQVIEPSTSYTVGRVRREFANQSSIGVMLTSTNRSADSGLSYLADRAATAGVDWDLRFQKRYSFTGYWVGSDVQGSPEAIDRIQENSRHYFQRPDLTAAALDVRRRSLTGQGGQLSISKIGGERVRFNSNVSFKSPGLDLNDVGFMRRADQRSMGNWLQIRSDKPNRWFRSRNVNFNQWANWNTDGDLLSSGGNVNGGVTLLNNWNFGAGVGLQSLGFDDRATRGGPGVYTAGYREGWTWLNSDNRRALSLNNFIGGGRNQDGASWFELSPGVTYRPVPSITFNPAIRYARNIFDAQWVDQITDASNHYVFAHLDQTTVAVTLRFNYTVSPNLSLQLYAQPFVSAGGYDGFRELANGRSLDYGGRYRPYAYDLAANGDPDFNVKSFRTTNVVRWEYKPGSTLFVVWQQARENDAVPGGFRFGRDIHDIFGVAPKNVFLVKLAYWLNY